MHAPFRSVFRCSGVKFRLSLAIEILNHARKERRTSQFSLACNIAGTFRAQRATRMLAMTSTSGDLGKIIPRVYILCQDNCFIREKILTLVSFFITKVRVFKSKQTNKQTNVLSDHVESKATVSARRVRLQRSHYTFPRQTPHPFTCRRFRKTT